MTALWGDDFVEFCESKGLDAAVVDATLEGMPVPESWFTMTGDEISDDMRIQ